MLNVNHKAPAATRARGGAQTSGKDAQSLVSEDMPVSHEKENLAVLEIMRRHTNRSTGQSSGASLRQLKNGNGEITETFPTQKSWDHIREKVELIEVVEASLQPELGEGGKPRAEKQEPPRVDYSKIDLYSEEVLQEEILF